MYLRNSGNSGGRGEEIQYYEGSYVDLFVPIMGRDKVAPKVMPGGNKLSIGMVSPKFFFQYDMLKMANILNVGFNENSHKVTAI